MQQIILNANNEVSLKTVEFQDAPFILELRTNSELNKYISPVDGKLESQITFIEKYKQKESQGLEYYFIILYKNKQVGTVRVYDIDYTNKTFTWGSWIIESGNSAVVAISSAYMCYYFAFKHLNLETCFFDCRSANSGVKKFHSSYALLIKTDSINDYFKFEKNDLYKFNDKFVTKVPSSIDILTYKA